MRQLQGFIRSLANATRLRSPPERTFRFLKDVVPAKKQSTKGSASIGILVAANGLFDFREDIIIGIQFLGLMLSKVANCRVYTYIHFAGLVGFCTCKYSHHGGLPCPIDTYNCNPVPFLNS